MPSLLSFLGLAIGGIADCLFIGNQLGEDGLAVVSFASPIYLLFSLMSMGISIGASIHYSSAISDGDISKGNKIFNNVVVFTLLLNILISSIGLIFCRQLITLLGVSKDNTIYPLMYKYVVWQLSCTPIMFMQEPFYYFVHCDNNPKLSAIALVIANIVDVTFNYILVVICHLGVVGSIVSTVFGAVVTISICMIHILSKKTNLKFKRFKLDINILLNAVKTGFATSSEYIYQFITVLLFNRILFSVSGKTGVAIFDVVYNISLLTNAISEGIGGTIQPMVSTFWGERNINNIKSTIKLSLLYGIVSVVIISIPLGVFANLYCPIFGLVDEMVLKNGVYAIRIYLMSLIPAIFNNVITYYFQSIEMEKKSYIIYGLRSFVFLILFGYILSSFGISIFWFCYLFTEVITMIFILIYCKLNKSSVQLSFKEKVFSALLKKGETSNSEKIEQLQDFCQDNGLSFKDAYFLTLTVDEVCNTIFCDDELEQDIYIQLTLVMSDTDYVLHMRDNKKNNFNPFDTNTEKNENIENDTSNIIGMKIVKNKSKEFYYRNYVGYNTLVIRF